MKKFEEDPGASDAQPEIPAVISYLNSTASDFVRPEFFILTGFSGVPYANYYYIFLFVCYAAAVVGNLFLMTIIIVVRSLHTPKYMAVFNLALADLGDVNALIPHFIESFLYTTHKMSYEACLVQMFFDLLFFGMQSLTLTVLAYDRFVAICFPLRYHSIVTNASMGALFVVLWLFILALVTLMVSVTTRLTSCNSVVLLNFFCEFGSLPCKDPIFSYATDVLSTISITLFYVAPMILVVLSYACILLALFKIASWEGRIKALKTCSSHFILVSMFFIPVGSTDVATFFISVNRNVRLISSTLSMYVPPMLNPIVYSLSTAEIREVIKRMFKRKRTKTIIPAVSK